MGLLIRMGRLLRILVASVVTVGLWGGVGLLFPAADIPSEVEVSDQLSSQSASVHAQGMRPLEECVPGQSERQDFVQIARSVDGKPVRGGLVLEASPASPPWKGKVSRPRTSELEPRQHLIGMGEAGVGLVNPQQLTATGLPAGVVNALWVDSRVQPFGQASFLEKQPSRAFQTAPIAGNVQHGKAVWVEQLLLEAHPPASYPWRIFRQM